MKILSLFFFLLHPSVFAVTLQAPDQTLSVKILPSGQIEVSTTPPQGHHFNLQAPHRLTAENNGEKKEAQAIHLKESGLNHSLSMHNSKNAILKSEVFLCDNAKTFCEKHSVSRQVNSLPHSKSDKQNSQKDVLPKKALQIPLHSGNFIMNTPDEAFAQAASEDKPLLIDFYGIWCPPCNMLDEEVFATKEFDLEAKKFILLKLDVDAAASYAIKSKYKVGGYPTVVFATSQGDEISRIVGYKGKKTFFTMLRTAYEKKNTSFEKLVQIAKSGDLKSKEQLGLIYLERKEWDKAMEYLAGISSKKEEYFFAKTGKIEEEVSAGKKQPKDLLEAYLESIQTFPDSPISINDRLQAAQLTTDPQLKTNLLNDVIAKSQDFQKNPKQLLGTEYTLADIYTFKAQASHELNHEKEEIKSWNLAAQEYENQIKKTSGKLKRGYLLEKAYCLAKSGQLQKAEEIYITQEKKYPQEFTFFFSHAKFLLGLKRYDEAEKVSKLALQYSYGDNHLRVVDTHSKILEAKNKKEQAAAFLKSELNAFPIPKEDVRTHFYLKNLKTNLDRLESKKPTT